MKVDDVPVATTPPGGWADWPDAVLSHCAEPLPVDAPDLRGFWETIEVVVDGEAAPDHPGLGHIQRIEQAADRVVVTAGGVVHDMRCDGTLDNGVHDVAEFDKTTAIHVIASYENGVHVLRPQGLDFGNGPIEVRRWRDGAHMLWDYVGYTARLRHLGPPDADPAKIAARSAHDNPGDS